MLALRGIRRSFSTAVPRKEYPTSFLSYLRTQKLNVFNIGVAFLTLSLSSQMVSYKQRYETALEDKQQLDERVQLLEKLVRELGGTLPEAEKVSKEARSQALCDREDEARALVALAPDNKQSNKSKLI